MTMVHYIYDWKRCKILKNSIILKKMSRKGMQHIHDTNYWHYTMQLNIYKYILETKYDLKVKDLHLVVIHPDNTCDNYEKIKCPFIQDDVRTLLETHKTKTMSKISNYFKKNESK